ncbi:helix-turn-helix domain-containing protein [Microbispora sp. SCL1-1]|uniref:helix-turn-helix domain-containing protein n=1 Tax=Microbispora TaxID=2005 RepID=UPI00115A21F3|nr:MULTISPECIES: helix-turn-helix transcriptional regulator [unclassified Microbispora]NJP23198.1 helix-turn-helix domain-containing protein [Microbispora sp. CL1-1]TQS16287.1 helix-turn-helix domain-containing protein [Microbispora sp. SCL1-1]
MSGFHQARMDLGAQLRRLRENARLSGKDLAERLRWQPSKVSRIENARQTATEDDVAAWGKAVEADPQTIDDLIRQAAGLLERHDSWRQRNRNGLAALQDDVRDLEARTRLFRAFEPGVVIGLLQTTEYARHTFGKVRRVHEPTDDVDDAIRVRMRRQEILYDPTRRFRFVMPEAVLRYRLAPPDVMRGQLDRLIAVTTLPNVEFGLLPFEAQLPSALMNSFWIYDDCLVGVATMTRDLLLRDAEDVAFYAETFEEFCKVAVFHDDARALIVRALDDYARPR